MNPMDEVMSNLWRIVFISSILIYSFITLLGYCFYRRRNHAVRKQSMNNDEFERYLNQYKMAVIESQNQVMKIRKRILFGIIIIVISVCAILVVPSINSKEVCALCIILFITFSALRRTTKLRENILVTFLKKIDSSFVLNKKGTSFTIKELYIKLYNPVYPNGLWHEEIKGKGFKWFFTGMSRDLRQS